jgi:hypothetical protein
VERHLQGVAPTTLGVTQKLVKADVHPLVYQYNSLLGKLGGEGRKATCRPEHIVDAAHLVILVVIIIIPCREEAVICREEAIILVAVIGGIFVAIVGIFVVVVGTCGEIYKVSEFLASTTKTTTCLPCSPNAGATIPPCCGCCNSSCCRGLALWLRAPSNRVGRLEFCASQFQFGPIASLLGRPGWLCRELYEANAAASKASTWSCTRQSVLSATHWRDCLTQFSKRGIMFYK